MRSRVVVPGLLSVLLMAQVRPGAAQSLIQIDRRSQLARADLDYDSPINRSEEGMPVGNGRMGSLVWTTPSSLKFQINRVDVHAMDSTTFSFPRADSDLASHGSAVSSMRPASGARRSFGTVFVCAKAPARSTRSTSPD